MKSPRLTILLIAAIALIGGCGNSTDVTNSAIENSLDTTPPPVPEHVLVLSDPTVAGGVLSWSESAAPDVMSYEVYEFLPDPTRESSYAKVYETQVGTTRWALPPVTATTVRSFRVCAVDKAGNRSPLSQVAGTTLRPTPRVQEPGPIAVPFDE